VLLRNLVNFFNAERSEVKAYLREADNITHELALKLPKNAKLGTMLSLLRGPIVYVCVRILKPDVMIETGVASGSSSARAMLPYPAELYFLKLKLSKTIGH
jgi:hypothetical protein